VLASILCYLLKADHSPRLGRWTARLSSPKSVVQREQFVIYRIWYTPLSELYYSLGRTLFMAEFHKPHNNNGPPISPKARTR